MPDCGIMTDIEKKREEIRGKVKKYIDVYAEQGTDVLAGMILEYLHSQGVVIKVDDGVGGYLYTVEPLIDKERGGLNPP